MTQIKDDQVCIWWRVAGPDEGKPLHPQNHSCLVSVGVAPFAMSLKVGAGIYRKIGFEDQFTIRNYQRVAG